MKIAVFRTQLLPYSETFIAQQFEQLPVDSRMLLGALRTGGPLPIPVTCLSGAESAAFRLSRRTYTLARVLHRYDAVLAHFAQDGWRIARTAQQTSTPLFVYCHGSDVLADFARGKGQGWGHRALGRNWTQLVDNTRMFFAASNHLAARLRILGVPSHKIERHYVGVTVGIESGVESVQPRNPALLFVGRLVPNKGIDVLLQAFSRVILRRRPDATLTVVGDGPLATELRTRYRDARIHFRGVLEPRKVREQMARSSLVVAPSRKLGDGRSEGLNQVVLEAQSLGIPVVTGNTGGLPEAVQDPRYVVDARSYETLGLACLEALLDESLWTVSSIGARTAFVRQQFDVRRQTASLMDKIATCL